MQPIVAAAVLHNGVIHSMPRPARHGDIVQAMNKGKGKDEKILMGFQGFIDGDGAFLDRREAGVRALFCGQIAVLKWPPNLYSEDLW